MTFHSGLFRVLRPALAAATAGGSVLLVSHPHAEPNMKQDILKQSPSQRKDGEPSLCEWLEVAKLIMQNDRLDDLEKRSQLAGRICEHVQSKLADSDTSAGATNSGKQQEKRESSNRKGPDMTSLEELKKEFYLSLTMSEFFPTQCHLLHTALSGSDKLERYDVFWYPRKQVIQARVRFGHHLSGHPGIVHGGAIASLFDDAFGVLFFSLKLGSGFTANLNVNYRSPIYTGRDVLYQVELEEVEGRKVKLKASVYDAENPEHKYADSTALFVVKHVASSSNAVKQLKEYLTELETKARKEHHDEEDRT